MGQPTNLETKLVELVRTTRNPHAESALSAYIKALKNRELARLHEDETGEWDAEVAACLEELKFELARCPVPSEPTN